jgi:hypothetical protein
MKTSSLRKAERRVPLLRLQLLCVTIPALTSHVSLLMSCCSWVAVHEGGRDHRQAPLEGQRVITIHRPPMPAEGLAAQAKQGRM